MNATRAMLRTPYLVQIDDSEPSSQNDLCLRPLNVERGSERVGSLYTPMYICLLSTVDRCYVHFSSPSKNQVPPQNYYGLPANSL